MADGFEPDLVEFVDGHGDVHHLVGSSADFCEPCEHLAVVDLQGDADAELAEDRVHDLHQFQFVQLGAGSDHVDVALVEFAVAALLRAVCAPHGLDLEALEREGNLVLVLHHVAGEGNGEVVTQALFRSLGGLLAAVHHPEQELVSLVAVLAEQGGQVLHCGSIYLRISEGAENALDRIEDVVPLSHFLLREISHAFWYGRFICHRMQNYKVLSNIISSLHPLRPRIIPRLPTNSRPPTCLPELISSQRLSRAVSVSPAGSASRKST